MLNLNHVKHLQEKTLQLKNILCEFEELKTKYIEEKTENEAALQDKNKQISTLKARQTELVEKLEKTEKRLRDLDMDR